MIPKESQLKTPSFCLIGLIFSLLPLSLNAQVISTEERFQDLFLSAGYGTAYGAAFGAALLSFQKQPQENLKFVAIGASVGFLTGSLLGSYIILSPSFSDSSSISYSLSGKELLTHPTHGPDWESRFILARF